MPRSVWPFHELFFDIKTAQHQPFSNLRRFWANSSILETSPRAMNTARSCMALMELMDNNLKRKELP